MDDGAKRSKGLFMGFRKKMKVQKRMIKNIIQIVSGEWKDSEDWRRS